MSKLYIRGKVSNPDYKYDFSLSFPSGTIAWIGKNRIIDTNDSLTMKEANLIIDIITNQKYKLDLKVTYSGYLGHRGEEKEYLFKDNLKLYGTRIGNTRPLVATLNREPISKEEKDWVMIDVRNCIHQDGRVDYE